MKLIVIGSYTLVSFFLQF